jgi:hypothetical protein
MLDPVDAVDTAQGHANFGTLIVMWMLLPEIFCAEGAPRALILLMMRVSARGPQ